MLRSSSPSWESQRCAATFSWGDVGWLLDGLCGLVSCFHAISCLPFWNSSKGQVSKCNRWLYQGDLLSRKNIHLWTTLNRERVLTLNFTVTTFNAMMHHIVAQKESEPSVANPVGSAASREFLMPQSQDICLNSTCLCNLASGKEAVTREHALYCWFLLLINHP